MADISTIKFVDRAVRIKHPGNNKYIGLTWTLCSVDDPSLASERRKIQDRRQYLGDRGKSFKAEEIEENQLNMLFKATRGWMWDTDEDGEPGSLGGEQPDFTRVNMVAIFKAAPWIKTQLTDEFTSSEDFFGN